jgi:diacylglycerol kinase family enzyme
VTDGHRPPPLAPDAPLFVVLNAGSGPADAQATHELIGHTLDEAGRPHRIERVDKGGDIAAAAQRAVAQAAAQGGAVVAAGGDGTINAVAQAAHDAGCPMGVLPQGTFNYFSRTHGIPLDTADATCALLRAQVHPVQIGLVNDRVFLVNASVGLYPQLLEDREQFKARFGRHRVVAIAAALATLLRQPRQLRLAIELSGERRDVRTPTIFVGNNRLQLERVGIPEARALDDGRVAAVMLKPVGTWDLLRLLVHGAIGTLGDADRVESFEFERMTIAPRRPMGMRRMKVAADGEVMWLRPPLSFRVSPMPLYLLQPTAS